MSQKYASIMIDVVSSRSYDNRDEIQVFLKEIVNYLNIVFHKSTKKPLMFSAGDEIQGLFHHPLAAYICARFFMMICSPIKIRVGIGYGELAFDNELWDSSELDGTVYHYARYAIESFSGKNSFGMRIHAKDKYDKYLNCLLYSSQIIQKQQSLHAQDVKLIAELLYPIYDEKIMNLYLDYKDELLRILKLRSNILSNTTVAITSRGNVKAKINVFNLRIKTLDISIHNIISNSDLLIDNTWRKGMSTMISEIMGTTRQNIDQHIRLGKVEENRRIDFSIAGMICEVFPIE